MATDYLSSEFKTRLQLRTKTVGADSIRRAKENNEDVAVLSMFLPGTAAKDENSRFRCALGVDCRLGDWRLATPGNFNSQKKSQQRPTHSRWFEDDRVCEFVVWFRRRWLMTDIINDQRLQRTQWWRRQSLELICSFCQKFNNVIFNANLFHWFVFVTFHRRIN